MGVRGVYLARVDERMQQGPGERLAGREIVRDSGAI